MDDTATDSDDLVALADALYDGVAADPALYAQQAAGLVQRARRDGPLEALVVGLRAQAWAEHLSLRNASAKRLLDEAVKLAASGGLERRLGQVLVSRVAVLAELGELVAAQDDVDRAIGVLPKGERMELMFQHGALLQNLGRLADAAAQYRLVLAASDASALIRAKAGNNLAHLESERGNSDVARVLVEEARAVAEDAGPTVRAYVAQTLASVEMHAGRLAESLARFDDAQPLFVAAGLPQGEPLAEYADALAGLGLFPEALEAAERGLAALPIGDASLMAAEAQLRVARLSLRMGDVATAQARAGESTELLRRQGRAGWLARARMVALEVAASSGRLTDAELRDLRGCAAELEECGMRTDAVEAHLLAGRAATAAGQVAGAVVSLQAADRLSRGAPVLVRLRGHVALALLGEAHHSSAAVLKACRAGLRDLERHRRALPTMELRMLASAHGAELGSLGLRALRPTATPARVFGWLERTRAAALVPLDPAAGVGSETEMFELRAVHSELAEVRVGGSPEPAALLAKVAHAEAAVRRASWTGPGGVTRATVDAPPRAEDVRDRLQAQVLVEYGEIDGQVFAVVVGARRTRTVDLGPGATLGPAIDAALFGLRRLARSGGSAAALHGALRTTRGALSTLRDRLVAPLGVTSGTPLVVVPIGELQRVPWAPLHDGPTTVVPAAAVWLRTASQALTPSTGRTSRVAVVAGPDVSGGVAEAIAIADLHRAPTLLLPPDSTCVAVSALLQKVDLVHFACHGRLRADNPAFSALLLSDGPLTVHELSAHAGTPRTVVLAACESGAQVAFAGGEALGLVSALLAGGTTGVIASSVLVSDEGTRALMGAVHEGLARGATVADALWAARQRLDTDDPHQLASWCAFDAFGGG